MIYSHNYSKLGNKVYTTIRRYSKGKIGDIITEIYPNGTHRARVFDIKRETLDRLSLPFLNEDTDLFFRKNIYRLFQSFYKKPIDFEKEKFYIYYLRKEESL